MMNFNLLDAAAPTDATAAGGATGTIIYLVLIGAMFGIMYLVMIRPQKKTQKAEEKMRNNIQIGDEILTIGGFYGRVISIKEDALVIESVSDHTKQKIARWAVQQNLTIHD